MSSFIYDSSTVSVLWQRDLKRFWRQPSRIVGALGQPLIFWAVIGSGMSATFHLVNTPLDYKEYFYPGVVLMVALFASIFASVSVIEDRHQGFLQAVLAGPGARWSLALGKCFGSASVALAQIAVFLFLAPLAGFAWGQIDWLLLVTTLVLATVSLSALGFAVAWWLDNVQAYHAIQMTLLVPLWVVSGAMFPPSVDAPVFMTMMRLNPVAYAVTATRHAMYGGHAPAATVMDISAWASVGVLFAFTGVALSLAFIAVRKR
jgi:daunorubicin resistance ABC transporter membrane protein